MTADRGTSGDVARPAVLCEDTLGHTTFLATLRAHAATRADLDPVFLPLPPSAPIAADRVPGLARAARNYTVRLSLAARAAARDHAAEADALLVHTQSAAYALSRVAGDRAIVVSGDGTPANYDEVAAGYDHRALPTPVERAKAAVLGRALRKADAVAMFSRWAADSAVRDYGVAAERVHVISPGVPVPARLPDRSRRTAAPRLLFVGGQFTRKGGPLLLDVLRSVDLDWELDIVTREDVPESPRVHVHHDVTPQSEKLTGLLAGADLMVLPTTADMFPLASLEAMAAGLPVIITSVGAIGEIVEDGVSGILVAPGDPTTLREAIVHLLQDGVRRASMGAAGLAIVRNRFDADVQARRLFDLVADARDARRH